MIHDAPEITESGGVGGSDAEPIAQVHALRTVTRVFAVLASLAGIEHGIGAIAQGGSTDAIVFKSWPDSAAFEIVAGEPALTLIPNLAVSGAAAIIASLGLAAWSLWPIDGMCLEGAGLILWSLAMLLVGAGFGPPLIGLILGVTTLRTARSPCRASRMRRLAESWAWLTALAVMAFLAMVPGLVLLSHLAGFESELVVSALGPGAFVSLLFALAAASAHDAGAGHRR